MCEAGAPAHQPNDDRATHRLFTGRIDKQPGAEGTEDAKNTHRFSHVPSSGADRFCSPLEIGSAVVLRAVAPRLCPCILRVLARLAPQTAMFVVGIAKKAANSQSRELQRSGCGNSMSVARLVASDGLSATICTVHRVSLLKSRADRNLSGSAQRTMLQIQERLRMRRRLARLHRRRERRGTRRPGTTGEEGLS